MTSGMTATSTPKGWLEEYMNGPGTASRFSLPTTVILPTWRKVMKRENLCRLRRPLSVGGGARYPQVAICLVYSFQRITRGETTDRQMKVSANKLTAAIAMMVVI